MRQLSLFFTVFLLAVSSAKTDEGPAYSALELVSANAEQVISSRIPLRKAVSVVHENKGCKTLVIFRNGNPLKKIQDPCAGLRRDGYAVLTGASFKKDGIVISSWRNRGLLYGAYALLEKAGYVFWAPEFENYPTPTVKPERIIFPKNLRIKTSPRMKYRKKFLPAGVGNAIAVIRWMPAVGLNTVVVSASRWDHVSQQLLPEIQAAGLRVEIGSHGFQQFLSPEKYPQWYDSEPGQKQFDFLEEGAIPTYVENVVAFLKRHREIDVFDAWAEDWKYWPTQQTEKVGGASNALAMIVNQLYQRMSWETPRTRLSTLAYQATILPPDKPYHRRIMVDIAPLRMTSDVPINQGKKNSDNAFFAEIPGKWRKAGFKGEITFHLYYPRGSLWHGLPLQFPENMAADMNFYSAVGSGASTYSAMRGGIDGWQRYEYTHWAIAQLMWGDISPEKTMAEYEARVHGGKRYLQGMERGGRILYSSFGGRYDNPELLWKARWEFKKGLRAVSRSRGLMSGTKNESPQVLAILRFGEFAKADLRMTEEHMRGNMEAAESAREIALPTILENGCFVDRFTKKRYGVTEADCR